MNPEQQMLMTEVAEQDIQTFLPITELNLEEYGLTETDWQAVQTLADNLDERNPLSIAEFGHAVGEHTASYTDELLEQVKNSDLEDLGAQLSQLVVSAQNVNRNRFSEQGSKIPIIGRYLGSVWIVVGNLEGEAAISNASYRNCMRLCLTWNYSIMKYRV